jgi:hypothetical protein
VARAGSRIQRRTGGGDDLRVAMTTCVRRRHLAVAGTCRARGETAGARRRMPTAAPVALAGCAARLKEGAVRVPNPNRRFLYGLASGSWAGWATRRQRGPNGSHDSDGTPGRPHRRQAGWASGCSVGQLGRASAPANQAHDGGKRPPGPGGGSWAGWP